MKWPPGPNPRESDRIGCLKGRYLETTGRKNHNFPPTCFSAKPIRSSTMTQANGDSHDLPTSEQNTKYDRQLRLWGAHGQKALMESRILLINAGERKT